MCIVFLTLKDVFYLYIYIYIRSFDPSEGLTVFEQAQR